MAQDAASAAAHSKVEKCTRSLRAVFDHVQRLARNILRTIGMPVSRHERLHAAYQSQQVERWSAVLLQVIAEFMRYESTDSSLLSQYEVTSG